MNHTQAAAFSFENFKIVSFSFSENKTETEPINIEILPNGKYFPKTGIFNETIKFSAIEGKEGNVIVSATLVATFSLKNPEGVTDIPSYFYLNSIAIIFPYLRAFITNMTLQANIKPMILPLLNLTGLEKYLKENTVIIDEDSTFTEPN